MAVVFDISRLLSRAKFETPTGIDRFELNYANWALQKFGDDVEFVESSPLGHRRVSVASARQLVAATTDKWTFNGRVGAPSLKQIVDQIEGGAFQSALTPIRKNHLPLAVFERGSRAVQSMARLIQMPSTAPSSSLFIHVSHSGLHKQSRYQWLASRGCLPLFYLHDLIPLLRPEFCRNGEADRHKARIESIMRLHRLIICNSHATARTLDELAEAKGMMQPCTAVLAPGIEQTFLHFDPASSVRTEKPYFVCVGTIEPRKNHALLLEIWRELVERHGPQAPRLVIVGRRGWDNAHVFSLLNDPAAFRGTVIEATGLDDRSMAQLLGGAAALLAPSHIEGYGMPVSEALALGTRVIASDIRAHREVSRGRALLLNTLDGAGWLTAIEAHAKWPRRHDYCEQKLWSWASHFDALYRLLVSAKLVPQIGKRLPACFPDSPRSDRVLGSQWCQPI